MRDRWADLDRMTIGEEARVSATITPDLIARTAALTGDDNPLHLDQQAAERYGQSRPIAHGQILIGLLSRLIGTELPGPGSVWFEQQLRFQAPIYADDVVTMTARVSQVSTGARVVILDVIATNQHGGEVMRGQAKVRVPAAVPKVDKPMSPGERVAVVTGGSRGVGRAIAQGLAGSGMSVVVNYRHDRETADAAVEAIRAKGVRASAIAATLGSAGAARALVRQVEEEWGRVDILVHAATPRVEPRPWQELTDADFRAYFDTYVVGLHDLVQAAAPGMQARHFGRVIAVLTSAMAEVPSKLAAYVAGKYALYGLCRSLAVELGPSNITVNCVSPGMLVSEYADRAGLAAREIVARKTPLRRLGQAQEVASVVSFLASDGASFISGANLPVTGGVFI
jgi:3-oxoacyl-[acyl-carrier protein] reductase